MGTGRCTKPSEHAGGKTYNGLLKHLMYVDNPHYRGVVIRKSSATIMRSGFIFDEAKGLYRAFEPNVRVGTKAQKFVFPSGAEIVFTHLATDEDAELLKGSQFSFALIDEATEIQENHVLRVLSRIRSKAGIPPQLALTCNPQPDSFLRKWVDWWLYPKGHIHAGRVDPEKDCKIRWFVRVGNDMCWGDSAEELIEKYGNPEFSAEDDRQIKPMSVQFISASIYDNPPLMKLNPLYLANLLSLPTVAKERDLFGNWDIRPDDVTYWNRAWVTELVKEPDPSEFVSIVRAYDFASTLPHETNRNPDYTASVKIGKLRSGGYVILDVVRHRITAGKWEDFILEAARADGRKCTIVLPQDPNVQAADNAKKLSDKISSYGYQVRLKRSNMGKLEGFINFAAASENGLVQVVKNCASDLWNEISNDNDFFYKELEIFTGKRKNTQAAHDDKSKTCRQ